MATSPDTSLPAEFDTRRLGRRVAQVVFLLAILVLVAVLAPGLDEVRSRISGASPGWLLVAVALELGSCLSYVAMFKPVFCRQMSWRTAQEIGWSELGVGSLVPASGAGGLALGAWILSKRGMPAERIAHRSVAFFLIKSSVNFVAVAALGFAWWSGLFGPEESFWLTGLPALMSALLIAAVLVLPRLVTAPSAPSGAGRMRAFLAKAWEAVLTGSRESVEIVRERDWLVLVGAWGYWLFDNAVLWATFHAFGDVPPLPVILMGYLIGQLGGLLPIPGGVGGIDGGLIGTLIVYGADPAATAAAVFTYRLILFWLPLMGGAVAFTSLRRALGHRAELCT